MTVTFSGDKVIIEMPISERSSKTGKSTIIASTNGNVDANVEYNGKPVKIGVNVYTPN